MDSEYAALAEACLAAGRDLGITIVVPFSIEDNSGEVVGYAAFLPDFGGPRGTLVYDYREPQHRSAAASRAGYFCSGLNPDVYCPYNRDVYVEALADWGWFGPESARPTWLN